MKLTDILKQIFTEATKTPKGKKVPSKYLKGLKSKGEYGSKEAMKKEIDKFAGKDEYKKDWKADFKDGKRIKTKKGAATKAFEKKFGEGIESIDESSDKALLNKSKKSGIPVSILRQVYNRGKAAWNQGHRPGTAQDQWAMGRVNSFLTGVGGARKADKDLWTKAKKSKLKEMSKDDLNSLIFAGEKSFIDLYVEKVQKESPNGIELSLVQSHFDLMNNPEEARDISFMTLSKLVDKNLLLKDGKHIKSQKELIRHLNGSDKIAFQKLLNYSVNETK